MNNKTCGECQWYDYQHWLCVVGGEIAPTYCACDSFIPIKPTNGDKILAGGMRAIAKFALHHCCNNCIYFDGNNPYRSTCGKPDNKTCEDGVEAWLNAPAESEVYNETTSN